MTRRQLVAELLFGTISMLIFVFALALVTPN